MFNLSLKEAFQNKTILITGGTGTIGSALCRLLLQYEPRQIRIYSRDDTKQFKLSQELSDYTNVRYLIGNIRDKERLNRATKGIDYIFHVAALKHVEICEYNPFEATKTNVVGTENVIDAAITNNVDKFLLVSTDKATNPTNTMGVTKLLAERLVVSANIHKGDVETKFSVVRFGNVFGSRGSVIPLFIDQIRKGKQITVTNPSMTRFYMTIKEAAEFVIESLAQSIGGEIFIKKMPAVKTGDLADCIIDAVTEKYGIDKNEVTKTTIGAKEGERFHEILFTEHESLNCYELEDRFVIVPTKYLEDRDFSQYLSYPKSKEQEYSSTEVALMSKEEFMSLIHSFIEDNAKNE